MFGWFKSKKEVWVEKQVDVGEQEIRIETSNARGFNKKFQGQIDWNYYHGKQVEYIIEEWIEYINTQFIFEVNEGQYIHRDLIVDIKLLERKPYFVTIKVKEMK